MLKAFQKRMFIQSLFPFIISQNTIRIVPDSNPMHFCCFYYSNSIVYISFHFTAIKQKVLSVYRKGLNIFEKYSVDRFTSLF